MGRRPATGLFSVLSHTLMAWEDGASVGCGKPGLARFRGRLTRPTDGAEAFSAQTESGGRDCGAEARASCVHGRVSRAPFSCCGINRPQVGSLNQVARELDAG